MTERIYRRRVLIRSGAADASADVEDDPHRFGVDIRHQGGVVRAFSGRALRTPWDSCGLAAAQLAALEGTPLLTSPFAVRRQTKAREHCTHMLDLACLAIAAAARGITHRLFDLSFTVSAEMTPIDLRLGQIVQDGGAPTHWRIENDVILTPARHAGKTLKSVSDWQGALDDDERLALFALRGGVLVSGGLRHDHDVWRTPADLPEMQGACFSFQPPHVSTARHNDGMLRDFSTAPDDLLADLKPS